MKSPLQPPAAPETPATPVNQDAVVVNRKDVRKLGVCPAHARALPSLLPAPLQSQTLRAPKWLHPASAPPISRTRIRLRFLPTPWGPCDAVEVVADVRGHSAPQLWFGLGPGGIIELRMTTYMSRCIYLETMLDEIEACAGLIMSLDCQMVLLLLSRAAETRSHPITRGPKPYDSYEGKPPQDSQSHPIPACPPLSLSPTSTDAH